MNRSRLAGATFDGLLLAFASGAVGAWPAFFGGLARIRGRPAVSEA